MKPTLTHKNDRTSLIVDGKPYYMRCGEVHNSCTSSLENMEEHVWPMVKGLNLNTIALPVYWELTEPEEGKFDFSLLDGLLLQARREKLRIVLLWFGLWKNAESTYAPSWVKKDTKRFFRVSLGNFAGFLRSDCLVSPCCNAAVRADAAAFGKMMAHLREIDSVENTVILVQVENEVGILGAPRDLCDEAQAQFIAPVPSSVEQHFNTCGNWESAFGECAAQRFSSYCFASAVEQIAKAGKKEYDLPMYVNAWTVQYPNERAGSFPSGGPVAGQWDMWRLCAPSIEFYSPDIYLTDFAAECEKYTIDANPLFVPEAHNTVDAAAFALYVAGVKNALGFAPFGIDTISNCTPQLMDSVTVQETLKLSRTHDNSNAAAYLAAAYGLIDGLWEHIYANANGTSVQSCLCMNQLRNCLEFTNFGIVVKYNRYNENNPRGALLAIELEPNKFLIAGVSCSVEYLARNGRAETVRTQKCEVRNGKIIAVKICNGDEIRPVFGANPTLYEIELQEISRDF